MKNKLGLLAMTITLVFHGCTKEENDLNSQDCQTGCTQIVGRLMTDNGIVPIAYREVTVVWDNTNFGSGTLRTKAITKTDSNGEFDLKFFIRDDELDQGIHRLFYDELNDDEFLRADLNGISIFQIKRDTILIRNHNSPKKATLNLTLLNLDNYQQGDYFSTNFEYIRPSGFSQSIDGLIRGWSNEREGDQRIEIAANQPVALEIVRRINGVLTRENDTLFVKSGTTTDYTVYFKN